MAKVCHISSVHKNTDGRIFKKECVSLAQAGFETYLVGIGSSRTESGVTVIGIPPASNRRDRMIETARLAYQKALDIDAEIYHLHDPELIPWGIKIAKKGKRVIFDSHENYFDLIEEKEWIPRPLRKMSNILFNAYYAHAMRYFSAIITVSPTPEKILNKYKAPVIVVGNYPRTSQLIEKANLPKTLVFAGGISEQWNHEVILDALTEFDDLKYVLCGPIEGSYLARLKSHPSWRKVDYKGIISFEEVQDALRTAGIGLALLSPSSNTFGTWGTLGNTKIFEEMAAGLPVICTNFDLWKEIQETYNCCICIQPDNKDELVHAIETLLSDIDKSLAMGRRGQKAIVEQYSWSNEAEKLIKLYRSILSY